MTQNLPFPILFTRGIGLTSKGIQRRQFSRSSPLCAAPVQPQAVQPRLPPQPKMSMVNQAEMQKMYKTRDDFGLLPSTFIMPTGANRPRIFSKEFLKMLWRRIYMHGRDFFGIIYYKLRFIKPRPEIRFRATKAVAMGLHRQMYEAVAAGEQGVIQEICTDGLRDKMLTRIQNRKQGETFKWEIVKEGWSKVVSHRTAPLPTPNCGLRQAVVRIKSTQKLTRYDAEGKELVGTGRPRRLTEYVVIQKKTWMGNEHRWKIWGTTNETTMAMLEMEEAEMMERYG